jgi:hypothetical protein
MQVHLSMLHKRRIVGTSVSQLSIPSIPSNCMLHTTAFM